LQALLSQIAPAHLMMNFLFMVLPASFLIGLAVSHWQSFRKTKRLSLPIIFIGYQFLVD
jgi:hypothetical protein